MYNGRLVLRNRFVERSKNWGENVERFAIKTL